MGFCGIYMGLMGFGIHRVSNGEQSLVDPFGIKLMCNQSHFFWNTARVGSMKIIPGIPRVHIMLAQ